MARSNPFATAPLLAASQGWFKAALSYQRMMIAANEVILRRTLQMATGTMSAAEATRMLAEKPEAFAKGVQQAGLAALRGQSGPRIAAAAINPVRRKAQSNAARLRRGKH
ncbi:antifreeze protein [Tropicimonas sp. IMCC34043]|uniref:antifreeze protein n=1 Tax=Tropicimonas sp. IMCC34043 TaxID=2248760 RepID=UPI000E24CB95|nr:antifreeze protein [Tropicimonas sp. IMCC34043]